MYKNGLKQYCLVALFIAMGSLAMMHSAPVLAQSSKCTVPSLYFPITPSGLTASTSELRKSLAAFERYQERIDAYNHCLVKQNKKRKYEDYKKRSAAIINQEIRLYNLRNGQACKITFDSKTGSLISNNKKFSDRLIKALWELEYPARIQENQTLNLGLRNIGIDITKSGRTACNNRYIYLRKSAQFYSLSKQCPLAIQYASAAKKILNASKSDPALKKESEQLDKVINNIQICLKKEEEQRTKSITKNQTPESKKLVTSASSEPMVEVSSAARELQKINTKNEALTTTNQELTGQLSNLQSKLKSTKQELVNSQQNEQKLKTTIEGLQTRTDNYIKDLSSADELVIQLQRELRESSQNLADLTAQVDNLEQQLLRSELDFKNTQTELQETQQTLEATQKDLRWARGQPTISPYWALLLIPFLVIGLILFKKQKEEELEAANRPEDFSDVSLATEMAELWKQKNYNKALKSSLRKAKLLNNPDARTYHFIRGYLKHLINHDKEVIVDFETLMKYALIELLGNKVAVDLNQFRMKSDSETTEYFVKGLHVAKEKIE